MEAIVSLARSKAKRCLPLLKTAVSRVFTYLAASFFCPMTRPPKAITRPISSLMGNITRS